MRCFSALAHVITAGIRTEDIACRYGGEEFLLVMPGASLETTRERAENVRQAVKGLQVKYQDRFLKSTTISLGVAIFPDQGPPAEEVIAAADAALYRAKEAGRDRVEIAASQFPGGRGALKAWPRRLRPRGPAVSHPGLAPDLQDGELHEPFGRRALDDGHGIPTPSGAADGHHFFPFGNEARIHRLHDDLATHLDPLSQTPQGVGDEQGGEGALELIHEASFQRMGEDGGLEHLSSQAGDLLVVFIQKLVDIRPLQAYGVPHHDQIGAFALQTPGGLSPRMTGGGRRHQVTKTFAHGLFHQVQTGRGVLRTHALESTTLLS